MDTKVLMTQQWLNETYAGTSGYSAVDEDGITGMGTIRALIWALQTELGISADGVFGDGTAKAFTALSTESDSSITTINHQIHILQGALYCKGQGLDPIYLNGVYTDTTKEAVRKFQEYAGLSTTDQTGIANAEVMKALLNTDAYTLLRSGDSKIREIQQALNNKYHSYIGLIPCDGQKDYAGTDFRATGGTEKRIFQQCCRRCLGFHHYESLPDSAAIWNNHQQAVCLYSAVRAVCKRF